tara:strand:+ start:39 stop:407 length:369 start_codon:yes stop_codon:yes gene_type:complete
MKQKKNIAKNTHRKFDNTYIEKLRVARLFRSTCALCGGKLKPNTKRKINFTFHHLAYNPEEKTYRNFKNSKQYNEYILPIIRANPKNFLLLHKKCHYAVEMAKKYSDKKWLKLTLLRRKSLN